MKNLFTFLFCAITSMAIGQITCTDYLLNYNSETKQYDLNLLILEGSTNTTLERAQYSTQISIVVPTGQSVELTDTNMPIKSNQSFTGTIPAKWTLGDQVNAPQSSPTSDFYSISAVLSPSSFYNNLMAGDVIHLFSFTVGDTGENNEDVRLFKNGIDPSSLDPGMGGGNFSNTFRIGNSGNIHNNTSDESCMTTAIEEKSSFETKIYPNPFQNTISLELPKDVKSVQVLGINGNVFKTIFDTSKENLVIPTFHYPNGIYIVRIETHSGAITSKRIVKF